MVGFWFLAFLTLSVRIPNGTYESARQLPYYSPLAYLADTLTDTDRPRERLRYRDYKLTELICRGRRDPVKTVASFCCNNFYISILIVDLLHRHPSNPRPNVPN